MREAELSNREGLGLNISIGTCPEKDILEPKSSIEERKPTKQTSESYSLRNQMVY